MSKYCPVLQRKVVYLDCMECEDKPCIHINWSHQKTPPKPSSKNNEKNYNTQ